MPKGKTAYRVFILHSSGQITQREQSAAPDLKQLQAAVGGWIETVPYFTSLQIDGKEWRRGRCYANEEGLIHRLPYNAEATRQWRRQNGSELVGDVIFYAKDKPVQRAPGNE